MPSNPRRGDMARTNVTRLRWREEFIFLSRLGGFFLPRFTG